VTHDQKGKQALKGQGRNQAKVNRRDRVRMVAQECAPRLRWRSSVFDHVLGDGRLCDLKPSLSSSPWMRGAPHNGFSVLICRIRSRNSRLTLGLPGRPRDSNANRPEIRSDASAQWCRAEPRGPIRAGSATAASAIPTRSDRFQAADGAERTSWQYRADAEETDSQFLVGAAT
jgi:hypothetical protein